MRETVKVPIHRENKPAATTSFAVSILAGGMSSRMGREKSTLRFEGRSLLGHVKAVANELGCEIRIIRRDAVSRCGPLGGIFTALKTSRADAELFLACDMPFVSVALLKRVVHSLGSHRKAAFAAGDKTPGFPFALRVTALPIVEKHILKGEYSIRALAKALNATTVSVSRGRRMELFNINTPRDWLHVQAVPRRASDR